MRDKNGRFQRNPNIEINIPSFHSFLKYLFLACILSPWIYTLFKFNVFALIEQGFDSVFGPKIINDCSKDTAKERTPY